MKQTWIIIILVTLLTGAIMLLMDRWDDPTVKRERDLIFLRTQDSLKTERMRSIARGDSIQALIRIMAFERKERDRLRKQIADLQRENDNMLDTVDLGTVRSLGLQEPSRFEGQDTTRVVAP